MSPSESLALQRMGVLRIALSHRVRDVRVIRLDSYGDDADAGGFDLLVEPTSETTLFDIGTIRLELRQFLGFQIDVVTPNALPDRYRAKILREAQPL